MIVMILNSEGESGGRGSFDPWQIVQHNIRDEPHKVIVNDVNDLDNCHDDHDPYIFSKHLMIVNDVNDHDNCNTDNDPLYI